MAEQPNISQILAALGEEALMNVSHESTRSDAIIAAQRPGGTPLQNPPNVQQQQPSHGYPGSFSTSTPPNAPNYNIPPPSNSGSLDLSNIKPTNSGSVSLADAVARARGIAAEKGVSYDSNRGSSGKLLAMHLRRLIGSV